MTRFLETREIELKQCKPLNNEFDLLVILDGIQVAVLCKLNFIK